MQLDRETLTGPTGPTGPVGVPGNCYLANVYKRPPVEQNYEKHRRERQAFALDCEMFPKVRALIVARSETTQSQAELDQCTEAIAWLDAKMGGF
jgi:hypothetical protein